MNTWGSLAVPCLCLPHWGREDIVSGWWRLQHLEQSDRSPVCSVRVPQWSCLGWAVRRTTPRRPSQPARFLQRR